MLMANLRAWNGDRIECTKSSVVTKSRAVAVVIAALLSGIGLSAVSTEPALAWTTAITIKGHGYEDGGWKYYDTKRRHEPTGTIVFNPNHIPNCGAGDPFQFATYKKENGTNIWTAKATWSHNSVDMPLPEGNPIPKKLRSSAHGTAIPKHNFYVSQAGARIYSWCVDTSYWKGTLKY